MGREPVRRLPGDIRPVYKLLKRLLPKDPACTSGEWLAHCMTEVLHPSRDISLRPRNVQRELGGGRDGTEGIHEGYFEAFKTLFGLPALGITDDILLHPDDAEREALIRTAMGKQAFNWLLAQERDEDAGRLDLVRVELSGAGDRAMGPATSLFEALPTDAERRVPIGRRFRFKVDVPMDGYLTILSRDPERVQLEGEPYQPTFCLDSLIGCAHQHHAAGDTVLPGEIRMDPPTGMTHTVMVAAREPFDFPWDVHKLRQLHPSELNRFMGDLVSRGADGYCVSTLEYEVTD